MQTISIPCVVLVTINKIQIVLTVAQHTCFRQQVYIQGDGRSLQRTLFLWTPADLLFFFKCELNWSGSTAGVLVDLRSLSSKLTEGAEGENACWKLDCGYPCPPCPRLLIGRLLFVLILASVMRLTLGSMTTSLTSQGDRNIKLYYGFSSFYYL